MKFSRRLTITLSLFTVLLLFSSSMNLAVSSQFEESSEDNISKLASIKEQELPQQMSPKIVDLSTPGGSIIMFDSFDLRDNALQKLPERNINYIYKYIPAISIESMESSIELSGISSITPNMKFKKQVSERELYKLEQDIADAFSLNQTSHMIGIDDIKRDYGLTGSGISIAILDTGVNESLPSFDDRVETTVVSQLEERGARDEDGHGTHVAGIAGSNGMYKVDGNWVQTDSPGMAPGANIKSIRVLDETGQGENAWILEGLEKAIDMDVDIISMSLSTVIYEGPNDPMQKLVNAAKENGTIVVSAAGNTGPIGSAIGIPAALDNVIAVGGSFADDIDNQELWSFSGIGPTVDGPSPDILAPGAKIVSLNIQDGTVTRLSGTSMATPHISGGIALLKEAYPNASYYHIREALLSSAEILFNSRGGLDQIEGQGRGQVRFDVAYSILNETVVQNPDDHLEMPIIPNIVQDRNYIYNHRLIDENKTLPFYIHTSRNITVNPVVNETASDGLTFHLDDSYDLTKGKNRINITLEVTTDRIQFATSQLYFVENATGNVLPRSYVFFDTATRFSEGRVLFDLSHDGDTKSAYFGNHGPRGQFSQLSKSLEEQGQIVHSSNNQTITSELLSEYDVLVIANPDKEYDAAEVNAIRAFVEDDGKSIFMMVGGGLLSAEGEPTYPSFNRNDLSQILAGSGIDILEDTDTPFSLTTCDFEDTSYDDRSDVCIETASFVKSQSIFNPEQNYPHFGPELTLSESDADVIELARADGNIVAAAATYQSSGRVMVFSSPLPFDNTGILYDYFGPHTAVGNEEILHTAMDWLLDPNQARMEPSISGEVARYFEKDMYEPFQIDLTPQDKDGNPIDLGDTINVSLQEYYPGQGYIFSELPFVKSGDSYSIFFQNGIRANVELTFHYRIDTNGSIPTDSRFTLIVSLKNYENQRNYHRVGYTILVIALISWIVWIRNEGGRDVWRLKQEQDI